MIGIHRPGIIGSVTQQGKRDDIIIINIILITIYFRRDSTFKIIIIIVGDDREYIVVSNKLARPRSLKSPRIRADVVPA